MASHITEPERLDSHITEPERLDSHITEPERLNQPSTKHKGVNMDTVKQKLEKALTIFRNEGHSGTTAGYTLAHVKANKNAVKGSKDPWQKRIYAHTRSLNVILGRRDSNLRKAFYLKASYNPLTGIMSEEEFKFQFGHMGGPESSGQSTVIGAVFKDTNEPPRFIDAVAFRCQDGGGYTCRESQVAVTKYPFYAITLWLDESQRKLPSDQLKALWEAHAECASKETYPDEAWLKENDL